MVALLLPNYLRLPGGGGSDGAAAGQVQSFLSGTEARRIKWRLPLLDHEHCIWKLSLEHALKDQHWAEGRLWRRHLRQNISKSCCLVRAEAAD